MRCSRTPRAAPSERVVALGIGVGSSYVPETDFKREVSPTSRASAARDGRHQGIFAAQYDTLRAGSHTPQAFSETVEELTRSLCRWSENSMDWMYTPTVRPRPSAARWTGGKEVPRRHETRLRRAVREVAAGGRSPAFDRPEQQTRLPREAQRGLREMRESEMWQTGAVVQAASKTAAQGRGLKGRQQQSPGLFSSLQFGFCTRSGTCIFACPEHRQSKQNYSIYAAMTTG